MYSTPLSNNSVYSIQVVVHSNVASPEFMKQRIDAFWFEDRELITELNFDKLQIHIQSVVKGYVKMPNNKQEEVQMLFVEFGTIDTNLSWCVHYNSPICSSSLALASLESLIEKTESGNVMRQIKLEDCYKIGWALKRLSMYVYSLFV